MKGSKKNFKKMRSLALLKNTEEILRYPGLHLPYYAKHFTERPLE